MILTNFSGGFPLQRAEVCWGFPQAEAKTLELKRHKDRSEIAMEDMAIDGEFSHETRRFFP